jgi:hypothetical protein
MLVSTATTTALPIPCRRADFSNFDETLANLLDDPTRAVSIAETAQKRYIDVTLGGAEIFVNRFASLSCLFAASRRTQPEAEPGAKV